MTVSITGTTASDARPSPHQKESMRVAVLSVGTCITQD